MSLTNAKPAAGCGNHGSRLHGAGFGPPGLIRDFPEGTFLEQREQMFHDRNKQEAENASECIQQDIVNIELPDSQPVLQRCLSQASVGTFFGDDGSREKEPIPC